MTDKKTGIDAARETADKLRKEKEAETQVQEANMQHVKKELAAIQSNPELMKMYKQSAEAEAKENIGSSPLLRVYSTGHSGGELADGSEPQDGSFFYAPTQEEFKNPNIHILVMSDGFWAEGIANDNGEKKIQYQHLIGGVLIADGPMRPFVMYISGMRKERFWAFRNEIAKFARNLHIPKFVLSIKMETEKIPNINKKFGKVWVINFSINRTLEGYPVLVTDSGEFLALEETKNNLQEMIDQLIESKKVEKPIKPEDAQTITAKQTTQGEVIEGEMGDPLPPVDPSQDVSPDDIPF